jgi:hypothetical protein
MAESLQTGGLGGRIDHQDTTPKTSEAAKMIPKPMDAPHNAIRFQVFMADHYSKRTSEGFRESRGDSDGLESGWRNDKTMRQTLLVIA